MGSAENGRETDGLEEGEVRSRMFKKKKIRWKRANFFSRRGRIGDDGDAEFQHSLIQCELPTAGSWIVSSLPSSCFMPNQPSMPLQN